MIFQYSLIEDILRGRKTQTRRPVKPGEYGLLEPSFTNKHFEWVTTANNHIKWQVGRDYAVQPKRGQPGLLWDAESGLTCSPDSGHSDFMRMNWRPLRIRITDIKREDCRTISEADAKAEGFDSAIDFLRLWCSIYDPKALTPEAQYFLDVYRFRPAALYDAWVITFEVVK